MKKTLALAAAGACAAAVALALPAGSAGAASSGAEQYIVTFADHKPRPVQARGVTTVRALATGGVLVRGDARAVAQLRAQAGVQSVELDAIMTAQAVPNDPRYPEQWHYSEATGGINAPGAWDVVNGTGVRVAVIDTGRTPHPDLDANTIAGYDFISTAAVSRDGGGRDPNPNDEGDWYNAGECGDTKASNSSWHGTHVAGTIAAVTNNAVGVAGVAGGAKVQHVRVLGKCGGYTSDIAEGIVWASGGSVSGVPTNTTPAHVINMSLGGSGRCSQTTQKAINIAVSRGTTVVVAAGNSNSNVSGFNPANCKNVVTVASNDREGNRSFYSNYGTLIDVTAPGGEVRRDTDPPGTRTTPQNGVLSTLNSGTTVQASPSYEFYMGTSMAAPHVAGLVALMLDDNPALTPAGVESALKANARPLPGACSGGCGAGIVDAAKTIAAV